MKKLAINRALRISISIFVLCIVVGVALKFTGPSAGQTTVKNSAPSVGSTPQAGPIVGRAANFGVSVPVKELPEVLDPKAGAARLMNRKYDARGRTEGPKEKNPLNANRVKKSNPVEKSDSFAPFVDRALSPAVPSTIPTPAVSFEGLSSMDNTAVVGSTFAPSDSVGDVGPNHYVQMTNTLVRVFFKDGTPAAAPFRLSSLTAVAGGPCANVDDGDPIVNYDPLADRWILSQFCVDPTPGHQVFAVSKTSDPTGQYYVYDFVHPNNKFQDYPHVAVWPDAYYMSSNQFNGSTFGGAGAFAYDRVKMLQGDPTASYVYFDQQSICPSCGGQLPSDLDGTVPPPEGMGNLFIEFRATEFNDPADGLRIFEFKPNFGDPAASTYTRVGATDLPLAEFDGNSPTSRNCVEQPGTTAGLDCIADRMMHRVGYRNLGTATNPVNSWVLNFTVNVGSDSGSTSATYQAGIRWAELRRTGSSGDLSVNQEGTVAINPGTPAGGTNVWLGSIAQDVQGNIFLGYNTSGSVNADDFPSIKYSGRLSNDPIGTMGQGEAVGHLGTGFQGSAANSRWGDYSSASVDPADECSFWYTQGYRSAEQNTSSYNWQTRIIGGIKMPGCVAPTRGSVNGVITACSSGAPLAGALVRLPGGFLATTNADGKYSMINVPVGPTSLSATKSGGFDLITNPNVVIAESQSPTVNLCLTGIPVLAQAKATLVSESCLPANGVIDPGETVTIALPVQNIGGADTLNTIGTLQATGGVTSPSTAQVYGALAAGGNAVTRNFTFTADAGHLCGTDLAVTVTHQDGASNLGNVVYKLPTGAVGTSTTTSYTGPAVAVPDNVTTGVNIDLPVSGLPGTVADLDFRFDAAAEGTCDAAVGNANAAMDHTFIGDLIFRLTSPAGTTVTLLSRRGGTRENICTTFFDDDGGFPLLSTLTSTSGQTLSGNFTPESPLSAFDGQNPNGTWVLNVSDNAGLDEGFMRRFSLIITPRVCVGCATTTPTPTPSVTPSVTPSPSPTVSPSPSPTPSTITLQGRVLTPSGRGISNARVRVVEANGVTRSVFSSSAGFFSFANMATGASVNVSVTSKLFRFSPVDVVVLNGMADVELVGLE